MSHDAPLSLNEVLHRVETQLQKPTFQPHQVVGLKEGQVRSWARGKHQPTSLSIPTYCIPPHIHSHVLIPPPPPSSTLTRSRSSLPTMSIPASRPDNLRLRNELTSRSVSYSKREEGERRREGREVKVVGRGEEERGGGSKGCRKGRRGERGGR